MCGLDSRMTRTAGDGRGSRSQRWELMQAQARELGDEAGGVQGWVGKTGEGDPGVAQLEPGALGIADSLGFDGAGSPCVRGGVLDLLVSQVELAVQILRCGGGGAWDVVLGEASQVDGELISKPGSFPKRKGDTTGPGEI